MRIDVEKRTTRVTIVKRCVYRPSPNRRMVLIRYHAGKIANSKKGNIPGVASRKAPTSYLGAHCKLITRGNLKWILNKLRIDAL